MSADRRGAIEEPIEPGWYTYSGGAQVMIFHLRETGQWSTHCDNGFAGDCAWGYIEQALAVWDLVKLVPDQAERDQRVRAEALREAAEAADRSVITGLEVTRPDRVAAWLRARADREATP